MAKREVHEEHENHERWLVSYADFITLLFAFFVVMYSVSRIDNKRMIDVVQSIKFAMHFKGQGGVDAMPIFDGPASEGGCAANLDSEAPTRKQVEAVEAMRRRMEKKFKGFLLEKPGLTISLRPSVAHFFDPNAAALRPEVIPILDLVAAELAHLHRPIRVEGYTDDVPPLATRYRDNWDLSASRAASVAAYLERAHFIPGNLLSAAGYGDSRPLASNDTPQGRELNRRLDLVVEVRATDNLDAIAK
ncbi:MAG: flagellar motor protein MotB [Polyangia bacterium]